MNRVCYSKEEEEEEEENCDCHCRHCHQDDFDDIVYRAGCFSCRQIHCHEKRDNKHKKEEEEEMEER